MLRDAAGGAPRATFAAFVVLGVGVSWLPVAAIFLEVPRLQRVLPEGLCLSSYLNIVVHAGAVALVPYLFFAGRSRAAHELAVRGILLMGVVANVASAVCKAD
eukprot:gene4429-262_t